MKWLPWILIGAGVLYFLRIQHVRQLRKIGPIKPIDPRKQEIQRIIKGMEERGPIEMPNVEGWGW